MTQMLSDIELAQEAARSIRRPRRDAADSFVLHAPLELIARLALLPYVAPEHRATARLRLSSIAAQFDAFGPGADEPPAIDFDAPERAAASWPRPSMPVTSSSSTRRRRGWVRTWAATACGLYSPTRSYPDSPRPRMDRSSSTNSPASRPEVRSPPSCSVPSPERSRAIRRGACTGRIRCRTPLSLIPSPARRSSMRWQVLRTSACPGVTSSSPSWRRSTRTVWPPRY